MSEMKKVPFGDFLGNESGQFWTGNDEAASLHPNYDPGHAGLPLDQIHAYGEKNLDEVLGGLTDQQWAEQWKKNNPERIAQGYSYDPQADEWTVPSVPERSGFADFMDWLHPLAVIGGAALGAGSLAGAVAADAGASASMFDEAGFMNPSSWAGAADAGASASMFDEAGFMNPESTNPLDLLKNAPSMPGSPSGKSGSDKSWLDVAEQWVKSHPFATKLGTGAGLSALQYLGNKSLANKNAKTTQTLTDQQAAARAANDHPAPWGGTGFTAPGFQPQTPTVPDYAALGVSPLGSMYSQPGSLNNQLFQPRHAASGGEMRHAPRMHSIDGGGLHSMRDSFVRGEGGGQEDNVPAALSPTEYVMDADVVAALGDGNPEEGARKLDEFRARVRAHKRGAPAHRIPPKAHAIERYMRKAA